MTTRAQIGRILAMLGAAYPRQAMSGQEIELAAPIWHELLGDLDHDLLRAAFQQHCTTVPWFPSIAELRQAALYLTESDADKLTAGEAWAEVALARSGYSDYYLRGELTWSSPIVEQAFEAIGGWDYHRDALSRDTAADRACFMQCYNELMARHREQRRATPALRGFRRRYRRAFAPGDDHPAGDPAEGPPDPPSNGASRSSALT